MNSIDPDDITNVIVAGKSGAGKQPRIDVVAEEFNLEQLSTGDIFRMYLGTFNDFDFKGDITEFWDEEEGWFIPDDEIKERLGTDDDDVVMGLKAKYFVDQGLYVPDKITNSLFESYFAEKDYEGQVLDGYPRTVDQSKYLMELVEKKETKIDFLLWVRTADEKIIDRITKRRICPECGEVYHLEFDPPEKGKCKECGAEVIQRSDDTEEKIRSRINEFKEKTLPAIEYLDEHGMPIAEVPGHLEEFTPENVRKSVMKEVEKLYE